MRSTGDEAMEEQGDLRSAIREAMAEFLREREAGVAEELAEERRRREQLEERLNELAEEGRRHRAAAEEAERSGAIRRELERLGVAKVELAYRAVRGEIRRDESGALVAEEGGVRRSLKEYLAEFVAANPELRPARMTGGTGTYGGSLDPGAAEVRREELDLERIKPGMSSEELERIRQEIARVAAQTLRGK